MCACHVWTTVCFRCQCFTSRSLLPMFSLLFVVFLDASFFCASFACHVLVPVHRCKMPVFHLELFVSRCFGPNGFFSLPLFSSAVCFPFFRSHSLFLDDPFCLDLFAFHVFFPVHFCKMTVFHLELFASRFFPSHSFCHDAAVCFWISLCFPCFLPSPFLHDDRFSLGTVCFPCFPPDSFF